MVDDKHRVEALLFSSGRPLTPEVISEMLGIPVKTVLDCLHALRDEYDSSDNAMKVYEENNAWRMNVKESYADVARKVVADTELDMPVMETLAVIAYKKNPLQADVIKVRGNSAYQHIKELIKFGFVSKIPEGRSFRLKLSDKFYSYFEIENQQDLDDFFKDVSPPPVVESSVQEDDNDDSPLVLERLSVSEEEKKAEEDFLKRIDEKLSDIKRRNDEVLDDGDNSGGIL